MSEMPAGALFEEEGDRRRSQEKGLDGLVKRRGLVVCNCISVRLS